jgi:hypothetical protein
MPDDASTKVRIKCTVDSANSKNKLLRIYDNYRTSLLNVKYYGYKLKWAERINLFCELAIAMSSASGVSAWVIWEKGAGVHIWSILAATGALSAAVKPILPLTKNISKNSQLYGGYNSNYLALKDLVGRIVVAGTLNKEMEREFEDLRQRQIELARDDEPHPSTRLLSKFQIQVNRRIPLETLWCPD